MEKIGIEQEMEKSKLNRQVLPNIYLLSNNLNWIKQNLKW
jgi:hypothetical protein